MALTYHVQIILTFVIITDSTVLNNVISHGNEDAPLPTPKPEHQIKALPVSIAVEEWNHDGANQHGKPFESKTRVPSAIADRPTRRSRRPVAPVTKSIPRQTTTSAANDETPKLERASPSTNNTAAVSLSNTSGSVGRTFGYGSGNYANTGGNYGNAGGGGGGGYGNGAQMYGGGAAGGNLMYFSNFDTALTTLAFLSFGVFLLNMIFSFLNMNNSAATTPSIPIGPGGRSEFVANATQRQRRELLSAPILLALSAIQRWELFDSSLNKSGEKITDIPTTKHCQLFTFCSIQMNPFYRQQLNEIISSIINRTQNRHYNAQTSSWKENIERFHQAKRILESGSCVEILDKCSNVLNPRTMPPS